MDTVTQITLGAAIGELTLGRKVGNKAVLWGGVGGLIPDLDMLAGPFLDPVSQLAFHRGFTHSITFSLLFTPLLAYLIYKIYRGKEATWWDWSKLAFWALLTHSILDCFTTYGTQFFWPFSDYRVAFSTIFVIDPVYSVPFLLSIIILMFYNRLSNKRRVVSYFGIAFSTAYLLLTAVNKVYINFVFTENFKNQDIAVKRMMTVPTPFNNLLWRGVGETSQGYFEGYYSLLDKEKKISLHFIPRNSDRLKDLRNKAEIDKLLRISKGFYSITEKEGNLYFNDMRYGRLNSWNENDGEFVFSFRINDNGSRKTEHVEIERERPNFNLNQTVLSAFFERVLGK